MLKIELQIKRAQLTERMHAQLMRKINRRVMERQLAERVPKHFEMTAYSEYGARPRSSAYNAAKQRKFKHQKPNVRTGYLKKSIRAKITATQYGSKLTMRAALQTKVDPAEWAAMTPEQQAKWKRKNTRRLADWQKREIAVMSRAEIAYERKRQSSEYKHGALSPEYKRKRTKRIK